MGRWQNLPSTKNKVQMVKHKVAIWENKAQMVKCSFAIYKNKAQMAKLVDARDLKSLGRNTVSVRVRLRALPNYINQLKRPAMLAFFYVRFNRLTGD